MKSLIVVDSLNGVRRNYNLFKKKKIDILSLDFLAAEFIKTNFRKSSTNIFDFYKKNERIKIFSRSIRTLSLLLKKLDDKHSKKISNIVGIKKMNFYRPLFLNILFYEFFSVYYFRTVFQKILLKNKYDKIYFIKNNSRNFSKVFKIEDQISQVLKKSSWSKLIFLKHNEKNFLKDFYLFLIKTVPNYKKLLSIISNYFQLTYLKVRNFKCYKNCLFFFKEFNSERIILKNNYKIFNMKKISKFSEIQALQEKTNSFLKKSFGEKNNDENFINIYFQKNLNLYLGPLLNFLNFLKKKNLISFIGQVQW